MTLRDRIYLTWNYGKAQFLLGGIYNLACTMLLAHGIVYALFVDVFILKAVFTAILLYLVHHLVGFLANGSLSLVLSCVFRSVDRIHLHL